MSESFWNIPDVGNVKVPLIVIREQATALSNLTEGLLRGVVETVTFDNSSIHLPERHRSDARRV
jgi:hypothetical protein